MASEQSFDIVVFGASGYTGRLVAEYLAQEYGSDDISWAMAGRSLDKLAAVRAEMGIGDDIPLLQVDIADAESIGRMVQACKVVITTVGPYQLYGDELAKQCAELLGIFSGGHGPGLLAAACNDERLIDFVSIFCPHRPPEELTVGLCRGGPFQLR